MKQPISDEEIESLLMAGHSQRFIRENYTAGKGRVSRIAKDLFEAVNEDVNSYSDNNSNHNDNNNALTTEDFSVRKHTVHLDGDGNLKNEWVSMTRNQEDQKKAMEAVVEAMKEEIQPEKPKQSLGLQYNKDLANCFIISDYHIGQLSWAPETGDNWDTRLAERTLIDWFGAAIDSAPSAYTAILAQIGDLLHHDGVSLEPVTPTSGNIVDSDTRFHYIVRVVIRAIRKIISMLLEKHEHVHVINAEGNHDMASSVWLRELFSTLYENEPRVTVDTNPDPYYAFEWGNTSIFFHHQHKTKLADVSKVFASKFREMFGRTKYSYAHLGHLHHTSSKEDSLLVAEQHQTLAAKDSFASRGGYDSGRGAQVITYSRKYGEVGRSVIRPEMLDIA